MPTRLLMIADTHVPKRARDLLNPGSPTGRRRQPHCTYLTAVAVGGRLEDVQLHNVERG